jgi:hypothetical protein
MKGWLGEGERVEADDDGYFGEAPQTAAAVYEMAQKRRK